MFYLTTHSTHFIYGYITSDIWLRTILIVRKETRCRHIGYSFRLAARVLLYAPSHRQDNTYHCLCYTSRGALATITKALGIIIIIIIITLLKSRPLVTILQWRSVGGATGLCPGRLFQPVLHDWCNKGRGMYYPVWDDAYKRTLAANRKE